MKSVISILSLLLCACNYIEAGGKRLQLSVIKHQPCSLKPSSSERIRFPPIEYAPIQDSDRGQGCYTITGKVNVWKPIRGTVQLYAETKYGTKAPSEKCKGADSEKCGGVGSCVYCHVCSGVKDISAKANAYVNLETGTGKKLDCEKGLNAGNYSDVRITFCMPPKEDFLKSQNMDEQFWNEYVASGRLFFVTIYIYNEPINRMSTSELETHANANDEKVIGCHRMVGTISES